jgi:hypothetical protein
LLSLFSTPGRFYRGNLHAHSNLSDGEISPERACKFYRDAGYDFISLTDHFLEKYGFPLVDTSDYRTDEFTTLIGAELHAPVTRAGEKWHLVANGLPLDFAPLGAAETAAELAQRALDAGAFVSIAHPEWYGLTLEDALSLPEVHAVEAFNGLNEIETGRGDGGYLVDQMLTAGRRPGITAVDDTHRYREDAFMGWVMVKAAKNSPKALLKALKAGDYYASEGPAIHHAEIDGDWLYVETSPVSTMRLLGQGARCTAQDGHQITRARLSLTKFKDSWARLVITDDQGKRAYLNPFTL